MTRPSVFELAGGTQAFLALATAHHERCLKDPVLNHPFSHPGHPEHVERLAGYWAEVFGGPPTFSEACGGQSGMLRVHAGNGEGYEDEMAAAFIDCFVNAADDAGLPDDPDLRATLRAYIEWAVGDVLAYAPRDSAVADGLRVPRWSWDGLLSPA